LGDPPATEESPGALTFADQEPAFPDREPRFAAALGGWQRLDWQNQWADASGAARRNIQAEDDWMNHGLHGFHGLKICVIRGFENCCNLRLTIWKSFMLRLRYG
jgi:hypothetical protein